MKVSVVTPTLPERRSMLRRLADQIARQTRRPDEWVVAGDQESLDQAEGCLLKWAEGVDFVGVPTAPAENVWRMHNMMCKSAGGDVIINMDDDDWQHPTRIARQVAVLETDPTLELIGTRCFYVLDVRAAEPRAYTCRYWGSGGVCGGSFAFRRSAWERLAYDVTEASGGEVRFAGAHAWRDTREVDLYVHLRHGGNKSDDTWWKGAPFETKRVKRIMGAADYDSYVMR